MYNQHISRGREVDKRQTIKKREREKRKENNDISTETTIMSRGKKMEEMDLFWLTKQTQKTKMKSELLILRK